MAAVNRSVVLTKLHKVLKKHYQPVTPPTGRSMLENLLYACCLENAHYGPADQAYHAVSTSYFDWNEVRVSTAKELSEVMKMLPNPTAAANGLKRSLQGVFEAIYSFDMESWKKQNLGLSIQKLEKCGCSPFVVAYVVQQSLGGHHVPLDVGAMGALAVVGLVPEGASAKDGCSGMERAIPKNKGVEFGSLLHQLSADFFANPYSPKLHAILLEVDPDAKARLPKRQPKVVKKEEPTPPPPAKPKLDAKGKPIVEAKKPEEKKPAAAEVKKPDLKKPEPKKPDDKKKATEPPKKSAPAAAAPAKKPTPPPAKKTAPLPTTKKPAAKQAPAPAKRKPR